ncbi:MAG: nucleoside hydrolase [Erysipelotrichaceae bacterium]|nr:nucleoside hydrolase [Erysipelotrichaceae bacterium]
MDKRKIIIDTDCGSDDAMAMAMALNDPDYEILMFTTVAGNVSRKQATANTLTTIKVAGSCCPPVYEGCSEMLLRNWVGAAETHGNDGMGDIGLVDYALQPAKGHAVLKMLEAIEQNEPKTIDIIALGPLTNLALAIRLAPETMKNVRRLVVMGTAGLGVGNVSPVAEFNIWQDAEAAKIVTDFGFDELVYVGWDACLDEAMLNEQEIEEIRSSGELGRYCIDSNRVLMEMNRDRFGVPCLDMADPAAMAAALYPECIEACDKYYCQVDVSGGPSYGGVLVDYYHFSGQKENAWICSKLNPQKYKEYIFRTLHVR